MYIIIVGCGKVGSYLAKLLDEKNDVVIIDKDEKSFEKLTDFNGVTIVGDALDTDVLKEAGIEKADAVCVITSNDNANIVIGQVAKKIFNVGKVIIRISDPDKEKICKLLEIETINTTSIFASLIRDGLTKKISCDFLFGNEDLTIIELNPDKITGKKIEEINVDGELQIFAIIRGNRGIIPEKGLKIEKNDIIIGIAKRKSLNKFEEILKI